MWWSIAAGVSIVLFAVREMFNDLFHPTNSGALSEWVASGVFRLLRRWRSMLATAGPLSVALVIGSWALLLATGFSLVYWPFFPGSYRLTALPQNAHQGYFWLSYYYSLEMLTTLGLGDIQPMPIGLRLLSALHTLLGFSLITASITWIVLVFPALRRMRTLARKANTLLEAERRTGVPVVSPGMHMVLAGLSEEVIQTRVDLIHFPLLFYFYTDDARASLPGALFPLMRFAAEGASPDRDALVRLTCTGLTVALQDLAALIGDRLECEDHSPDTVFRVFAELHSP